MSRFLKKQFVTGITDLTATDVEGVGVLRYESEGKVYRWVKNRNATAFTAKQPVCYDVGNIGSVALFEAVNSPVTADLMVAAGCAVTAIAASGGLCFGWVLVEGWFADVPVLDISGTAIAVGDELNAVNAQTYLTYVTAVGTAPKRGFTFYAMETSSGDTGATVTKDVFISCLR